MNNHNGDDDLHAPVLSGRGASDYERYLRTDELLSLQKSAEERGHHDELLFQTVHQSSELWLKLAWTEIEEAAGALEQADPAAAARLLQRSVLSLQYITTQIEMLNQMNPWDYHSVRVLLGHGSGFDSPGFRRLPPSLLHAWRAFEALRESHGVSLTELYQRSREFEDLYRVAELLIELDERLWLWRHRHFSIVARVLGEDTVGIQGTPVQVLGKLIAQRQLPKLWDTRSRLTEEFDSQRG